MNKLLIICGATATGKTKLAIDLAKKLQTEIISADSQLIYKGLDIGTAKPDEREMGGVKHHLIDVVLPDSDFRVIDYAETAKPIIKSLLDNCKIPIICGGTGFYINSLLYDLSYGNTAKDDSVRRKYEEIAEEKGKEYLFSILKQIDPPTAEKLHCNDVKRVIRALEIYEISGKKKSDICDELKSKYEYLAVAIDFPRDELYKRIDLRVDEMFKKGLVGEVENLLNTGIDEKCQCMQAIGYKEVVNCLKNGNKESIMRDIIKLNTRHYAKRQITFFKKMQNIVWLKPQDATAEYVLGLLNGK